MDPQTLQFYDQTASETAAKYRAVDSNTLKEQFKEVFPTGARVLDAGTGSGRDLALLLSLGFDAFGMEPSAGMRTEALRAFPQLEGRIFPFGLPLSEHADTGGQFDGVVCSAVLMHVPEGELFDAAFSLKRVLREKGKLWISVPAQRSGLDAERRDEARRLFEPLHPDYLLLLFERLGFHLLRKWEEEDRLARPGLRWNNYLFQLDGAGGRLLDRIEGVLNRDRKTATYKLALFRALSELGTMNYHQAEWLPSGEVSLPLRPIAEKWFRYYWPLFESPEFIPQNNGEQEVCAKPVAFRKAQMVIIDAYRSGGGLSQFLIDEASGQLSDPIRLHYQEVLQCIENTIRKGPVVYASGNMFKNAKGRVIIEPGAWRTFCQLGHWIEPAVILRWAEETRRMSNARLTVSEVLNKLVVESTQDRNVGAAKFVFETLQDKRCVWSDKRLDAVYDVDHVIPFSFWHCNDLWNLLPCDKRMNGRKSDKLPERSLLFQRKDTIVFYWEQIRLRHERRFEREIANFVGRTLRSFNWQGTTFQRLVEAVEVTAIQRGVARWRP